MLVKFLNGYIADISNIKKEFLYSEETYRIVYDYIIEHQEETGISKNDLLFVEQIDFFDDEDVIDIIDIDILYIFIKSLDDINIFDAFYCIEKDKNKNMKAEIYLQWLADRHMLYLSTSKRYCELWFMGQKVCSTWDERSLEEFKVKKIDEHRYLCKKVPVSIGDSYCVSLIFDEEDLD